MKRIQDYGVTQPRFLWIARDQGVGLDDPMATPARVARLVREGLIHQRTSKAGRVSWRTTPSGTALIMSERNLPLEAPEERDGLKRETARRRKGRSKVRTRGPGVELITEDAAATLRYWRERCTEPLFVYFIQEESDGAIKIGEAQNPLSRIEQMQCGNPRHLKVVAVVLAGRTTEWQLHSYWRSSAWIRGEWFGRGQQPAIIAKARDIAEAQIQAHRDRVSQEDVQDKVFVQELFRRLEHPAAVV